MASVQNIDKVLRALKQAAAKYLESPNAVHGESVIVGYTAAYALHVHERIEMSWKGLPRDPRKWPGVKHQKNPKPRKRNPKGRYWDPQGRGQAKFLEQPARQFAEVIADIVTQAMLKGAKLQQALFLGGLRLQRESMLLVPVDTGNLKASAFTRKE